MNVTKGGFPFIGLPYYYNPITFLSFFAVDFFIWKPKKQKIYSSIDYVSRNFTTS